VVEPSFACRLEELRQQSAADPLVPRARANVEVGDVRGLPATIAEDAEDEPNRAPFLFGEHGDSTDISQRLTFENGRLRGAFIKSGRPFELVPTGTPHAFWFETHDATGPVEF